MWFFYFLLEIFLLDHVVHFGRNNFQWPFWTQNIACLHMYKSRIKLYLSVCWCQNMQKELKNWSNMTKMGLFLIFSRINTWVSAVLLSSVLIGALFLRAQGERRSFQTKRAQDEHRSKNWWTQTQNALFFELFLEHLIGLFIQYCVSIVIML